MLLSFFNGLVLAFGLILPLGPQNMYILQQGLQKKGFVRILPIVLTAAICDTILILLAVFGISSNLLLVPNISNAIVIAGVFFLVYMGIVNFRAAPARPKKVEIKGALMAQLAKVVMLSFLNPHAIIDSVLVISATAYEYHGKERMVFTLACIITSWIWFFALGNIGNYVKINGDGRKMNIIAGCVMWICAILLLKKGFYS